MILSLLVISDRPIIAYCLFSLQSVLFLISLLCVLLSLHEDLSVIEGDEWFGVLSGQDHDTQVSV